MNLREKLSQTANNSYTNFGIWNVTTCNAVIKTWLIWTSKKKKKKKIRIQKNNIFSKSFLIVYIYIPKTRKKNEFQKFRSYKNNIIIIFHYSVRNFSSSDIIEKGEKEFWGDEYSCVYVYMCAIVHLEGSER